jgi:hypothetical protein
MIRNFSQLCLLIGVAVFLNGVIARAEESPHGKLAMDCQSCHVTTSWRELRDSLNFDHNSQTKFPLEGKHSVVRCIKCHTTLVFADAGTRCLDCHADIHRGQFDADCDACHTPQRWIDNPDSMSICRLIAAAVILKPILQPPTRIMPMRVFQLIARSATRSLFPNGSILSIHILRISH